MTGAALVKASDLKRMADVAKAKGVRVEMEIDGKIIRVMPETASNQDRVDPDLTFGGNSLAEWRARHESKSRGNSPRQKASR